MRSNCPCGIEFEIGDAPGVNFSIEDETETRFVAGDPVINAGTKNYEDLINKPQINMVELIGNLQLHDLFPDGIIINGGDAVGYDMPLISEEVGP